MPIDFLALRSQHRLAEVARRAGYPVDAASGDVMMCCPRPGHDDRTPSMILHLDTDRYHCFGCGAQGDVVQWLRDTYSVGVAEAVRMLNQAGPLSIPPSKHGGMSHRTTSRSGPRADAPNLSRTSKERVLAVLETAWRYYSYGALHAAGVAYLADRGIDIAALESEVGAPVIGRTPFKAANQFVTKMHDRGFTDDELVDAGLARRAHSRVPGEPRTVIDFYRRRFVVPVRDEQGRVIGLIGRYDGDARADGVPKYLNPPRTVAYDKAEALYRPSTPRLDRDGQVVVVEGTIDALGVAAAAAEAGLSSKFAPVSESGTALSDTQVQRVMTLHDHAPVLAADGDPAGGGANTNWATALARRGRESAIVTWPEGEDPASWLATHGTAGLIAVTRKGCLEASEADLRPRHSARQVAQHILNTLPAEAGLEDRWRAAFTPCGQMRHAAAERYSAGAAETLAPVVVTAALDASADGDGRVNDVILIVASYGFRLPFAAQVRYAEVAALEIERADLGPARWAARRIQSAITGSEPHSAAVPAARAQVVQGMER